MRIETFASDIQIITLTSTTTAKTIKQLVAAAGRTLLNTNVIGVRILPPSANVEVGDPKTTDKWTMATTSQPILYSLEDAHEKITLKNAATVTVEIFYGQ